MRKILLITAGHASLLLGIVGIFLPLLPTTPFLLLAAACYLRASHTLYHWLTHHRLFGDYIRCYRQFRAVSVRAKIVSVTLLWSVIGLSAVLAVDVLWLRGLLIAIALGVTAHILRLRTMTAEMRARLR